MILNNIKLFFSLAVLIIAFHIDVYATPEFSLWSGNKCSECHNSHQGGGSRTEFGFQFAKDASFFPAIDFPFLEDYEKNSIIDSTLYYGMDFRFQSTRSHKLKDAERKYYPMQASAYLTYHLFDGVYADAQYNIGPKIFTGQQAYAFYLMLKPFESLPYLKIGYFLPAIGLRDCDMTDLDRRAAVLDGSENLIAPDFAEWGIEAGYSPAEWLDIEIGMFDASSLSEVTILGDQLNLVTGARPTFTSRMVFWLNNMFEELPQTYLGGSNLVNDLFVINTAFMGFAPFDDWLFQFKAEFRICSGIKKTGNTF